MAVNVKKELDAFLSGRVEALLAEVAEQPPRAVTPEKQSVLQYALYYEPTFELVRARGLAKNFVDLLLCPDIATLSLACSFCKNAYPYQQPYGELLGRRMMRMMELVGDDTKGVYLQHDASSLLCHLARNEYVHENILESSYSMVDMFRSREWLSERTAGTLSAYAFTNPHLLQAMVGVTSKTDLVTRANHCYNKSHDYIARRMSLKVVAVSGRGRAYMTNDDVNTLRDGMRYYAAAMDAVGYFAAASSWALVRHYFLWGLKGQVGTVVACSAMSGTVSAVFGVYTGEYLRYLVEEAKLKYLDAWGVRQRKDKLRKLKRSMAPLAPGAGRLEVEEPTAVQQARYENLKAITDEVWELKFQQHSNAFLALGLLTLPLPWFFVVPRVFSTYGQLRLGPRFHRLFPALSIKYTKKARAIIPFTIVPTVAMKLSEAALPDKINPFRLLAF
eukprot:TRINITY_DN2746_c0_g3_i1.p1 TRINITY_DN2746_c0_g3~~TRINITY_DN2746_c0_g3_i1.p1  ORF type:complete len:446 (+),score=172.32 TRINITY_DN2746_c0_g3_i1:90-1427(+)